MFYIYHIPGIKIGCTQRYPQRCIDQGFDNYELLETHDDIEVASDRELELQEQYGFTVNTSQTYLKAVRNGSIGARLRKNTTNCGYAGKGKPKKGVDVLAKALNTEWTCEVCGKSGKGRGNYARYHKNKH